MKSIPYIALVLTAVLAAVSFSYFFDQDRPRVIDGGVPAADVGSEHDRNEDAALVGPGEGVATSLSGPGSVPRATPAAQELNRLVSAKRHADSALKLEQVIQDAELMNLDIANDWRMQLEVLCHPSQIEIFSSSADDSDFAAWGQEFCAGYVPDPEFSDRHLGDYYTGNIPTRRQVELDRLLDRELSDDQVQIDDDIKRTLRSARFEEEILAVSDYLVQMFAQGQLVLWRPVPVNRAISNERVVDLQSLAIELYACRRFLNCGPRSIKMLMNCTYVPICEAWWTYEDFVAASLAPYELDYVHRVVSSIGA